MVTDSPARLFAATLICLIALQAPGADAPKAAYPGSTARTEARTGAQTNEVPEMKLSAVPVSFQGIDLGTYATLTAGTNKYEFQVPKSYITRMAGQKVTLSQAEGSGSSINVGFERADEFPSAEVLEAEVGQKFPDAKVTARFATTALGTNAPSFQLLIAAGVEPWPGRVIYIPVKDGRLVVSAMASPKDGGLAFSTLQQVLSSLTLAGGDPASPKLPASVFQ